MTRPKGYWVLISTLLEAFLPAPGNRASVFLQPWYSKGFSFIEVQYITDR